MTLLMISECRRTARIIIVEKGKKEHVSNRPAKSVKIVNSKLLIKKLASSN